ncbi:MAG: DUF3854 domain-containing protein [Phycisphaerales bacterium]|nr:DUF3854 domain-containing protein [Phycisphaerales bacterium]
MIAETPSPGHDETTSTPVDCHLDDRHITELRGSGLTDDIIRAAGLYSVGTGAVAELLGWRAKRVDWGRGLAFPYRKPDGSDTEYVRVKLDFPRHDERGTPIKYESPRGKQNRAYFPPGFANAFARGGPILITEGEKKTLAAAQAGFCCVGLVGVWSFQQKRLRDDRGRTFGVRQLLSELVALDWKGRVVVIVFDSDVVDRPDLQLAEFRLSQLLADRGAEVKVARLPRLGDGKTGLDDFLVHHGDAGAAELTRLIESAAEPALPNISGPMDVAKILVDETLTGATGLTLRYWREDYWRFTGRCYVQSSTDEFHARVLMWLDKRGFAAKPRHAADVVKCLAALCLVPFEWDMPCWLDGEEHGEGWVSFANGLFRIDDPANIRSMPHTARYFSPWAMEYAFDPGAECPTWIAFLDEVVDADPERIDLLQRWFGLLLSSNTSFQRFLLLIGPPRAGKGTVVRTIVAMIGKANCASPSLSSLATRFGLASLLSKTVAVMPDAHIGKHADAIRVAEVLKSIVGEDPQDIDRKYREPLNSVRLPTRFAVSCNELAHFNDPSGALAARMSAVPFFNSYLGREDRTLERRLQAGLPGIVNWSIVGYARLCAEGRLNVPTKSQSIHDNFKRLASPIAAFAEDCLELHPTFSEPTTDVYAAWVGWCRVHGHVPGSDARMGERLRAVNASVERNRFRDPALGGERRYVYRGLRLTSVGREHSAEGYRTASADHGDGGI